LGSEVDSTGNTIAKNIPAIKKLSQAQRDAAADANFGKTMDSALSGSLQSGAEGLGTWLGTYAATHAEYKRMKVEQAAVAQQISALMATGLTAEDDSVNKAQDTSTLQGGFKMIIGVILDFGKQFANALIAVGIAKMALDELFKAPGMGLVAIAAGVALLALVGAVQSKFSGGIGGSSGEAPSAGKLTAVPAYASGGIVSGNSFSGDSVLSRLNSGEMVLNSSQQRNLFNKLDSSSGNSGYPSEILLRVQNGELQAVLQLIEKRDRNLR